MMLTPRTYRGSMSPYMKYLPRLPSTCRSELLSYKFTFSRWLVGTKHFPVSILGRVFGFWEVFWICGDVFLDSGKRSGFWDVFLDSGKCFGFWEVFLDSGKCFGFWDVFLDSGKCFGFWEVFCPYEPPYISHIMQL